ncbi:MAG: glycosyltransferase family 39 protein [Butyrivibrio sp.]|nr:glycosyltransferase family 39 protein [Butyrivibrio sp.]
MNLFSVAHRVIGALKKVQRSVERYVLPVILLIWPFAGVGHGLDLADTTYALGNYLYLDRLDPMWLFSTWLANALGALFTRLPGGGTMLGMEIYCTLIISVTALSAYLLLGRWFPGWMNFLGLFLAESLFWCPTVILYNTLTSLFLVLGILILLHACTDYHEKKWKYVLAGVCFGLNVMVRLPNVVQAVCIVLLWFYGSIHRWDRKRLLSRTGLCILGWGFGFGLPLLMISVKYGFAAYPQMMTELLRMSGQTADYSGSGQLYLILASYGHTLRTAVIIVPCLLAGAILLLLRPGQYYYLKRILCGAGLLVLFFQFYRNGFFTRNYRYLDSVFELAQLLLLSGLVLYLMGVTRRLGGGGSERSLALASILILLLAPVGSNNATYPLLNHLFLPLPVLLWLFRRIRQFAGTTSRQLGRKEVHFAWKGFLMALFLVLFVQASLFHLQYGFGDGYDGAPRTGTVASARRGAELSGETAIRLMTVTTAIHTSEDRASSLLQVANAIDREGKSDAALFVYGDAPGFNYLLGMSPALPTTWPSLDSYRTERFVEDLGQLSVQHRDTGEPLPVVVTRPTGEEANGEKDIALRRFLEEQAYGICYEDENCQVYRAK